MVLGERQKHLEVLRATWTQPWSPSQGCLETASRAAIGNGSNRPKAVLHGRKLERLAGSSPSLLLRVKAIANI